MTDIGPYIGLYLGVIGGCLRTSSRKEPKGICLCKQATNVEDSSRTIVILYGSKRETEFNGLRVLANVKRPADEVDEEWPSWVQKWQDPDPNLIIRQLSSYVIDKNSAN